MGTVLMWVAVIAFGLGGIAQIAEGKKLLGLGLLLLSAANR